VVLVIHLWLGQDACKSSYDEGAEAISVLQGPSGLGRSLGRYKKPGPSEWTGFPGAGIGEDGVQREKRTTRLTSFTMLPTLARKLSTVWMVVVLPDPAPGTISG